MSKTEVLYNDTCPVCSFEINGYARRVQADGLPVRFDRLDCAANWGLTPDQAARQLHVRQDGVVLSGLPAFQALWRVMPRWRWLARLTALPGFRPLCILVYDRVAAPLLYRAHLRRQARGLTQG